jgi:ferredoxin
MVDQIAGIDTQDAKGSWICPSTRAFLDEARRTPGFSPLDFLHGYVYSRWPHLYIGFGTGEHRLSRLIGSLGRLIGPLFRSSSNSNGGRASVAEAYHGKVVTTEAARQLVMVRKDIRLQDLEQVIPYRLARDIILKNPDHIVAFECPCRASRAEPCLPLDVCLVVGEPFAGFIAEHHPGRARWVDSEEACDILEVENARGHVHHAFFKDAMLGRFYGICNCCSCCCGAMQAMRNGIPMLAASGYTSTVALDLCIGCGDCVQTCPFGAMELFEATAAVDRQKCMGCGVCVTTCDTGALSLVRDPAKSEPLEIESLLAQAEHGDGGRVRTLLPQKTKTRG